MSQSTRKLLGIVLILLVLVAYAWLASSLYMALLIGAAPWLLLGYFAVAGLLWAVPVGFIIYWMSLPDRPR